MRSSGTAENEYATTAQHIHAFMRRLAENHFDELRVSNDNMVHLFALANLLVHFFSYPTSCLIFLSFAPSHSHSRFPFLSSTFSVTIGNISICMQIPNYNASFILHVWHRWCSQVIRIKLVFVWLWWDAVYIVDNTDKTFIWFWIFGFSSSSASSYVVNEMPF